MAQWRRSGSENIEAYAMAAAWRHEKRRRLAAWRRMGGVIESSWRHNHKQQHQIIVAAAINKSGVASSA
jgi:hypothetical protein